MQRSVCRPDPRAPERVRCRFEPIGAGEVVRTVDERCAIVRIASATVIGASDVIELVGTPPPPTAVAARERAH